MDRGSLTGMVMLDIQKAFDTVDYCMHSAFKINSHIGLDPTSVSYFLGTPLYSQITTANMYLLIKIRYIIHIRSHGNHIEMEKRSNIHLK